MNKSFILLSQVFMTFMMAASMSGLMSLIHEGPTVEWLKGWPLQLVVAWPIAFCLTMVAWPAAMRLAGAVLRARGADAAQG
ncbi:DUF2798 domain-containing protein [Nocardioides sp. J54]|uniref:DUF2798 domain-containing protein n=1 Tax=Nocardioides sp. J54 TaxID=935866 RepID=UPI00049149B6|nr:DUF2798 domain-containing protein [Nocardioides sp. J54]